MWSFWTWHCRAVDERWPGAASSGQVRWCVLPPQWLPVSLSHHTLKPNFHFRHRIKIQKEKYVHRLLIPSTRMSDAGKYTVVAGGNMSSANLFVEGRDVRIRSIKREVQVIVHCCLIWVRSILSHELVSISQKSINDIFEHHNRWDSTALGVKGNLCKVIGGWF